jgi:hypothetical protein
MFVWTRTPHILLFMKAESQILFMDADILILFSVLLTRIFLLVDAKK